MFLRTAHRDAGARVGVFSAIGVLAPGFEPTTSWEAFGRCSGPSNLLQAPVDELGAFVRDQSRDPGCRSLALKPLN